MWLDVVGIIRVVDNRIIVDNSNNNVVVVAVVVKACCGRTNVVIVHHTRTTGGDASIIKVVDVEVENLVSRLIHLDGFILMHFNVVARWQESVKANNQLRVATEKSRHSHDDPRSVNAVVVEVVQWL